MKRTFIPIALLCACITMIALSCGKNYSNVNMGGPTLNQTFAALKPTPQKITVQAGVETTVFGAKGTLLHFYPNSFRDANGHTLTSGNVDIQLTEMYKPGDMIANRATTMSGGQILRSGGQINISATVNGQPVFANRYGVGFMQQQWSPNPMTLFYGNTNNGDSIVNWQAADTTQPGAFAAGVDTSGSFNTQYGRPWVGYVFDSASTLQYTNCDAFYENDSPKTSVTAVMPDSSFTPSNTQVYLILPDINCAMSSVEPELGGASWNKPEHSITIVSEGNTNIVPQGMNYKLIVITNKNGQYYYWQTSGVITHQLKVTTTPTQTTQADVTSKLDAL